MRKCIQEFKKKSVPRAPKSRIIPFDFKKKSKHYSSNLSLFVCYCFLSELFKKWVLFLINPQIFFKDIGLFESKRADHTPNPPHIFQTHDQWRAACRDAAVAEGQDALPRRSQLINCRHLLVLSCMQYPDPHLPLHVHLRRRRRHHNLEIGGHGAAAGVDGVAAGHGAELDTEEIQCAVRENLHQPNQGGHFD